MNAEGYVPLTEEEIQEVKAECCAKYEVLWIHNFPRMLENKILEKIKNS